MKLAQHGIGNNVIEVLCLEDDDRYRIYYDGTIDLKYKDWWQL